MRDSCVTMKGIAPRKHTMQKKTYRCPELKKLGSAAEMTQWRSEKKKHWWFDAPQNDFGDKLS